jgi:toxin ParE1/3/4
MSFDEARSYRLTPRALDDLELIWRHTAETWSVNRADAYADELTRVFETLAVLPTLARERKEFNPPVRIHVHESHLIIYLFADQEVVIVRLLGGRQDWISILKAVED